MVAFVVREEGVSVLESHKARAKLEFAGQVLTKGTLWDPQEDGRHTGVSDP